MNDDLEEEKAHIVLDIHPSPDPPRRLDNNDVPYARLSPFAEDASDFFAGTDFGYLETHHVDGGLDPQGSSEPGLWLRHGDSRHLRWRHRGIIGAAAFSMLLGFERAIVARVRQCTTRVCMLRVVIESGIFGD